MQTLMTRRRQKAGMRVGVSTRGSMGLLRAAKEHALLHSRDHVVREDVQTLFVAVAGHRLVGESESSTGPALARAILQTVAVD